MTENLRYSRFKILQGKWNIGLCVYSMVLASMNFVRIFDNSFWGDEGYSILLAKMSVPDMIEATAGDVHPPLYYLFVQLLYHLLGDNGPTYHLSGWLPYFVIVILGCSVVIKYFGTTTAMVLITMSSLMDEAVTYNTEARMYSLAAMLILIAYIAFSQILRKNCTRSWIVFFAASVGAAYTHYYALVSVGFIYLMLIPLAIKRKNYRCRSMILYAATALAYLPWLRVLLVAYERTTDSWWLDNVPSIRRCVGFLLDDGAILAFTAAAVVLFFLYQTKVLRLEIKDSENFEGFRKIKNGMKLSLDFAAFHLSAEAYWVISGMVAVAGTIFVGLALSYAVRPFLVVRYLFPLSAALYLMIGYCISKLKFSRAWTTVFVLLILCTHLPTYISTFAREHAFDKGTQSFLAHVHPEKDAVIETDNYHLAWSLLDYYYPGIACEENPDVIQNLDQRYEHIWLFWGNELDDSEIKVLEAQNYTVEKVYESDFANEFYYYAYRLTRG